MEHSDEVMRICVSAWLTEVHDKMRSVTAIEMDIRELEARLDGLGARGDGPRARSTDPDKIAEMIARLDARWDDWHAAMGRDDKFIEDARARCPASNLGRWICWLHWANDKTWAEVAEMVHYSKTVTRERSWDGIRELYAFVPESIKRHAIPNAMPE